MFTYDLINSPLNYTAQHKTTWNAGTDLWSAGYFGTAELSFLVLYRGYLYLCLLKLSFQQFTQIMQVKNQDLYLSDY